MFNLKLVKSTTISIMLTINLKYYLAALQMVINGRVSQEEWFGMSSTYIK